MPRQIRIARALLVVVAFAHGAAIVFLMLLQGAMADQIKGTQPSLNSADVSNLVLLELLRAVSFHALLVIICGIYAAKVRTGSPRVFRVVVGSQVLSVIFGVITCVISPDVVRVLTPPFVVAALAILLLLFGSERAREFFSAKNHAEAQSTASR